MALAQTVAFSGVVECAVMMVCVWSSQVWTGG